jgi:hypothetical protein
MSRTITEMTHNISQVFLHPNGLKVTYPRGEDGHGYAMTTVVDYEEPMANNLDDLASRIMGALVTLAALSGAAEYDRNHPGDGTMRENEVEDVCSNRPVTSTTLANLLLEIDPTSGSVSEKDLRSVLCLLAESSVQVDFMEPASCGSSTRTRFISFVFFSINRSQNQLGYTVQYTFSHPLWVLANA